MKVGRVSSATRHCQPRSGHAGSPSSITIDERTSSAATSAFHIIHEVVLNHSRRPPGFRSQLNACAFDSSSRMPPCPWTIAFGRPVVPDEKSTNSGWSNATGSNSSGPGSASSSVPGERVGQRRGRRTERARRVAASEGRRGSSPPRRGGRSSGRGTRSRRPRAAPSARAARGGRSRCARRAPARSSPRPRRGSRSPRTRPASRGCSAGTRRRGRRGRRRAARGPPARGRPARGASPNVSSIGSRVCECATTRSPSSIVVGADQMLGEVQPRAREPRGAGHRVGGEHGRVRARAPSPRRTPRSTTRTPARSFDRPAPELVVVCEHEAALALEPVEVAPDLGRLPDVRRRRPQDAASSRPTRPHQGGASLCPMLERDVARRPRHRGAVARDQLVHRRPSCGAPPG